MVYGASPQSQDPKKFIYHTHSHTFHILGDYILCFNSVSVKLEVISWLGDCNCPHHPGSSQRWDWFWNLAIIYVMWFSMVYFVHSVCRTTSFHLFYSQFGTSSCRHMCWVIFVCSGVPYELQFLSTHLQPLQTLGLWVVVGGFDKAGVVTSWLGSPHNPHYAMEALTLSNCCFGLYPHDIDMGTKEVTHPMAMVWRMIQ